MTSFRCWFRGLRPASIDHAPSEAALERACVEKERVEARWPEVENLRAALRRLREKNHFIEGFRKTL